MLLIKNGHPHVLSCEKLARETVPLLVKTRQRSWDATYRGIYPDEAIDNFDFAWHEKQEYNRLRNPDYHCFLLMEGDACAGYFAYGNVPQTDEDAPSFRLHSLYILPDYQGWGLGKNIVLHS